MKHIVLLSGAGVSAESGLSTFRDHGGLWDEFPIEEVATLKAWENNPKKVIEFYNLRREMCYEASPNAAHQLIADLEKKFSVSIITQNIDDLHERAGSSNVLHLHGKITNSRSSVTGKTYSLANGSHIKFGEKCPDGFLLRPDVVWFGEEVPNLLPASHVVKKADILLIIGTSLQVYPASSLVDYVSEECQKILIDPKEISSISNYKFEHIQRNATDGMKILYKRLIT